MLNVLGLDDLEVRLYDRLLDVSSASAAQLATDVQGPLSDVLAALSSLERRGLVSRSSLHPDQVSAAPPDVGLGSLIADRQASLRRAQLAIPGLVQRYRDAVGGRDNSDVVDAVHGADAVAQRFAQLQRGARREVLALVKPAVGVTPDPSLEDDLGVARGVDYRVVVTRPMLDQPGFLARVARVQSRGEQVRVVEQVPLRLLIADRELALIPLDDEMDDGSRRQPADAGALLVRPSGLLDAMVALFELVWQRGHRVVTTRDGRHEVGGSPLDDLDLRILSLLLAGFTDQTIGKQLGLSLRTVQRRARALMDATGVSTRLQLGYEVARRGWI